MEEANIAEEVFKEMDEEKIRPKEQVIVVEGPSFFSIDINTSKRKEIHKALIETVKEKRKIEVEIKELRAYKEKIRKRNQELRTALINLKGVKQ